MSSVMQHWHSQKPHHVFRDLTDLKWTWRCVKKRSLVFDSRATMGSTNGAGPGADSWNVHIKILIWMFLTFTTPRAKVSVKTTSFLSYQTNSCWSDFGEKICCFVHSLLNTRHSVHSPLTCSLFNWRVGSLNKGQSKTVKWRPLTPRVRHLLGKRCHCRDKSEQQKSNLNVI